MRCLGDMDSSHWLSNSWVPSESLKTAVLDDAIKGGHQALLAYTTTPVVTCRSVVGEGHLSVRWGWFSEDLFLFYFLFKPGEWKWETKRWNLIRDTL